LLKLVSKRTKIYPRQRWTNALTLDKQFLLDDKRVLEQALENIDKHFCMVGLMERFAESVDLLGKKLDWQSAYEIPHLNVVSNKHIQEVDAQTQAALEKYNRLDMLLYEHVSLNFSATV